MDKYLVSEKFGHKIYFGYGSSTGYPGYHGMQTSDVQDWWKLDDFYWFRPYGDFRRRQILDMIDICRSEFQLISLFELLSAKYEDRQDNG